MKQTREEMLARARGLEWAIRAAENEATRWIPMDQCSAGRVAAICRREARRLRKAAKEMEKR